MIKALAAKGWINDPRATPQSNSAQVFAAEVFQRRPQITNDEIMLFPDLVDIILNHNQDPHDTDLIGTVCELLDYIWARIL